MGLRNLVDRFTEPKTGVARAVDRYIVGEKRKEKRRLERRRREIRKIARRVNDPSLYNL